MSNRTIPCPNRDKLAYWDAEFGHSCPLCKGSSIAKDLRTTTASDRAVERLLDAVDHARAIGMSISPEFIEDIIREEENNEV